MATTPTRTEKRKGFDMGVRMALVEQDLDIHEGIHVQLLEENKKGNRLLMLILTSLTTGAVLLAADIVTRGLG